MKKKKLTIFISAVLCVCCTTAFGASSANAAVIDNSAVSANLLQNDETETDNTFPESYSSKDLGYVTSIKSQAYNDCWAYAGMAAFESKLLRSGFVTQSMSESHLNIWATTRENGTGWQRGFQDSGYAEISLGYLTSWQGGVEASKVEDEDFLDGRNGDSLPTNLADYGVTAVKYLETRTDVKQAITDNGGVYASYGYTPNCETNDYVSYFLPQSYMGSTTGHAIEIVGWDDNYSVDNFKMINGEKPKNNGAWLIKNSWGNYNALNGYFWLSYEDKYLFSNKYTPFYTIESVEPITKNVKLEQNEIYGATYEFSYVGRNDITYINKFDFSNGYNTLDKVVFKSSCKGAKYNVYYIPVNGNNPVEDESQWIKLYNSTVDYKGYICADISDFDLPLGYGAIGIQIDTSELNGDLMPESEDYTFNSIGVNEWLNTTDGSFVFLNDSQKGESYIYYDEEMDDLLDWYSDEVEDEQGGTFVIKAVTTGDGPQVTLLGDVDLNGRITINDATEIQKYLLDLTSFTDVKLLNADVTQDGRISISDATQIQKQLVGIL